MNNTSTLTGTYIAAAGLVVAILAKIGVFATVDQVAMIIGGMVAAYGIIHQIVSHKTSTPVA